MSSSSKKPDPMYSNTWNLTEKDKIKICEKNHTSRLLKDFVINHVCTRNFTYNSKTKATL
jgi:hypothetical protein